MSKVNDIINGWGNYLKGSDPATLELAIQRAEICAKCPTAKHGLHAAVLPDYSISKIKGMYCSKKLGGCGCPISTAVRSKEYKCSKGFW
jgi:hypothetical protein